MECGALCKTTWDVALVAQTRCNAFKFDKGSRLCDMGVVGPFGGDFDTLAIVDKPGVNVLHGCLPKSTNVLIQKVFESIFTLKLS